MCKLWCRLGRDGQFWQPLCLSMAGPTFAAFTGGALTQEALGKHITAIR